MKTHNKLHIATGFIACIFACLIDNAFAQGAGVLLNSLYGLSFMLYFASVLWLTLNRVLAMTIVFSGIAVALLMSAQPQSIVSPILLVVWATHLPLILPVKQSWFAFVLTNVALVCIAVFTKDHIVSALNSLSFIGFQLFSMSNTLLLQREFAQRQALEQTTLELAATQHLLTEKTKTEERSKIYRDLHDSTGHRLTAIGLNIEHAKHQAPNDWSTFLSALKTDVSDTLNEIRAIVRASKYSIDVDLVSATNALIAPINGVDINTPNTISVSNNGLAQALIFVLKEGISNALRHGNATLLTLTLERRDNSCTLLLADNGRGISSHENGNGIQGIKDRLAEFDATVTLSNNGHGATLAITLASHYFSQP